MGTSLVAFMLTTAVVSQATEVRRPGAIRQEEVEYQTHNFKQWWGIDLGWKFEELPTEGKVPDYRIPYSGFTYPDRGGGTINVLYKYDAAFHGRRRGLASEHERQDVGGHRGGRRANYANSGGGLFARIAARARSRRTPGWYGHCNGWTAAAIRHAEPQRNVSRNGVVFTPADIKALLAEIYMYSDTEFLGGIDTAINPALLHVILTNWVGRGSHPVGMEATLGEVVWNYPIYKFTSKSSKRSDGSVEVRTQAIYADMTNQEFNKAPHVKRAKNFHYLVETNDEGKIVGGRYYNDSDRIDMLWTPLKPVQGGEKGNERGNPHVDVKEVLAMWRESVPEEARKKWLNVDPTKEDRIVDESETVEKADDAETEPRTAKKPDNNDDE